MIVKCVLIIKVLNKVINIVGYDGSLPFFELQTSSSIKNQINLFVEDKLNIPHPDWLNFRELESEIQECELNLFYTCYVPKDAVNENNLKFINDYSSFSIEIQQKIQQAIRIPPYN